MQIHIWRQFSSNHSADFTVVGEFDTPEAAERAAIELRNIVRSIMKYHMEHPEFGDFERADFGYAPTPPEIEIGQKYGFDWFSMEDWIKMATPPPYDSPEAEVDRSRVTAEEYKEQAVTKASTAQIKLFDRCVFVDPTSYSVMGPVAFYDLIPCVGAKRSLDIEVGGAETRFHITFEVQSDEQARNIQAFVERQIEIENKANYEELLAMPMRFHLSRDDKLRFMLNGNTLQMQNLHFFLEAYEGFSTLMMWLRAQNITNINYETEYIEESYES